MRASVADAKYMDSVEQHLNEVIELATKHAGYEFVDTYDPTIGHDACKPPGTRYIEPLVKPNALAPVHPNDAGAKAVADLVYETVKP
jgi:hypothetical protein